MGSPSTPEEKIMPDEEDTPHQAISIDDNPNDVLPNAIPQPAPEPHRSTHIRQTPVADDDKCYIVMSYGNTTPKTNTQVGDTTLAPSQANIAEIEEDPPTSYRAAMSHPDSIQWQIACAKELDIFKLYEVVDHPTNHKISGFSNQSEDQMVRLQSTRLMSL
jgi:hypothetical protein